MAKKRYHESMRNNTSRAAMRSNSNTGLIMEDKGAPALLPMHVISKDFPKAAGYTGGHIDDLFTGVEKSMATDHREFKGQFDPKKY